MPSLKDKLRSAMPQPSKKASSPPPPTDCYVAEKVLPRHLFPLPDIIDTDTLYLLTGEMHDDLPLHDILFLDTETTGLSGGAGTVAFEIGVGFFDGQGLHIRQYVMRDYDEEALMLAHILDLTQGKQALCTFNGKTFDIPLLQSRMIMQRMRLPAFAVHLDLLHISRRVFRLRLGHCNLSALEEALLCRRREDDLPGSEVPERYFSYLKTGNFSLLDDVLRHNFQDVASLADILYCLTCAHIHPEHLTHEQDIYSVGRVMLKRGRLGQAQVCFRLADKGTASPLARSQLAYTLKKERDWEGAAAVYEQMIRAGQCSLEPYIALAKLYEHRLNRIPDALRVTLEALRMAPVQDDVLIDALRKRYIRLVNKQGGS